MRSTYKIIPRDEGGWSVTVHGARITFDTIEQAVRSATLAARTDQLCGRQPVIAVQQADGTFQTRLPG